LCKLTPTAKGGANKIKYAQQGSYLRILQTENRISQSMAKKPLAEKPSFIPATALEKQSILKDIWRFIGIG